jgi:hypothetical protein
MPFDPLEEQILTEEESAEILKALHEGTARPKINSRRVQELRDFLNKCPKRTLTSHPAGVVLEYEEEHPWPDFYENS